ncbi:MAG: hypothetical protein AMXMBFR82_14530 [Candidatus Hydrogenedentota bacterium]
MTSRLSAASFRAAALLLSCLLIMTGPVWADASINIRNASGFASSTTVVGVNFNSDSNAVAVNFRVNYDASKLLFVSAEAGSAAESADKEVAAEEPSSGVASIVVFGLNNNVIPNGRLVNMVFIVKSSATIGQQLSLVGSHQASTDTNAQPIATTISDGILTVTQCTAPDEPSNFKASDGDFGDHVKLTWDPANGATSYRLYRNSSNSFAGATVLAVTANTQFNDFGASPAAFVSSGGCGSGSTLSFTTHYYWVQAQSPCGASDPVGADTGYRGSSKAVSSAKIYEEVLPAFADAEGIHSGDAIAIRLRSDEPIASVWGYVSATDFEDDAVEWVPLDSSAGGDGWVVYRPQGAWYPGEVVTMMVGGLTAGGNRLGPLTYAFPVVDSATKMLAPALVEQPGYTDFEGQRLLSADESQNESVLERLDPDAVPELPGSVSSAYRIMPEGPFAAPQRVWLPVPEGLSPDALSVYYHQGGTWFPARNVEGFAVNDGALVLELENKAYLGILVRHGGVVALGPSDASEFVSTASLAPSQDLFTGFPENVLLLGAVIAILGVSHYRTSRRRQAK